MNSRFRGKEGRMSKRRVWNVTLEDGDTQVVFATEAEVSAVAEEIARKMGTNVKTIQQRVLLAYYAECVIRWLSCHPRAVSVDRKEGS